MSGVQPDPHRQGSAPEAPGNGAQRQRPLGEIAALISAGTGLLGLLLGFFGLPAVVNPPTATQATAIQTVPGPTVTLPSATVTVTASATGTTAPGSAGAGPDTQRLSLMTYVDTNGPALGPVTGTLNAKPYDDALGMSTCPSRGWVDYNIGRSWKRFTASAVGIDDNSPYNAITVEVFVDDRKLASFPVGVGNPQTVDVDITGGIRLGIAYSTGSDCHPSKAARLVIAEPLLKR
ncbi:NPCBM/NEW2 domain-containing protein [Kitasatospora sp. NPDC057542]|uniref:NPCBM/NEW2 domain-containing protein n=1 Tax=Streptomycetaceae TaxID=2062 RepID=UPI001CCFB71A|nr:NPCBM/NEW2 domain-containing protein [Streptomyces sp. LS1784]